MKTKTPKLTLQLMAAIAVLLALNFILGKLSIGTNVMQFSLNFIDNTVIGSIAGPVISFVVMAIWDIVSFFLAGKSNFIIWFSLIEGLQGLIYGYFFYGKTLNWSNKKDWIYVTLATALNLAVSTFFLTPLALHWYFKVPLGALYATRAIKVIELPLRVLITMLVMPQLQKIPELRRLMGIKKER